jgi:cysteine desulfurase
MAPYLDGVMGNASSVHRWGREARAALEEARARVGGLVDAPAEHVFFVRGGTESDNLAVLGRFRAASDEANGKSPPLLVRTPLEHSAVREAMDLAADQGARVEELPVHPSGEVDAAALEELLRRRPALVSVQWVNHDTGLILGVEHVAEACREAASTIRPFQLSLSGMGVFPGSTRARVMWVGFRDPEGSLPALARALDDRLAKEFPP